MHRALQDRFTLGKDAPPWQGPRMLQRHRRSIIALVGLAVVALATWRIGRDEAQAAPVVARYDVALKSGACLPQPLRVAIVGDLHMSPGTTPPAMVTTVVARVNALHPDLILLVGDYLGHNEPTDAASVAQAIAPLGGLRARLGIAAVLGNNDWEDAPEAIASALATQHIHVLRNNAWVTPEVAVLGVEELISNTANPLLTRMRYERALVRQKLPEPPVELWIAHQPIMFDRIPRVGDMLFTGHTHGGQILPAISVPVGRLIVRTLRAMGYQAGWPGEFYVRGRYRNGKKRMIVTSGVGVSGPQIRLGVPPEIVLTVFGACDGSSLAQGSARR